MSNQEPIFTQQEEAKRLETQTLQIYDQPSLFDKVDEEKKAEDVIMRTTMSNSNCVTAPATSDLFKNTRMQSSNQVLQANEEIKEQTTVTNFEITDQEREDAVITSEEEKVADEVEPVLSVHEQMEARKREWVAKYKRKLDLNDVLEIRNPQSVIEFVPEIIQNM